ncbi:hypothetical protein HID58_020168, partial [Brassica napus]
KFGLRFSGITRVELHYEGVVNRSGGLGRKPPHFFKPLLGTPNPQLPSRSDFQSGLYDRFLAMNRGNDLRCGPGLI